MKTHKTLDKFDRCLETAGPFNEPWINFALLDNGGLQVETHDGERQALSPKATRKLAKLLKQGPR